MTPPPTPETIDSVIGIVGLFTGPRRLDARAALRADLALDWIDRQGIALELGAVFGIDVSDEEVTDWDTVEDIARTVQHRAGTLP